MSSGLSYLHSKQFMHRDLKPENIMVCISVDDPTDDPMGFGKETVTIKLGDFGLARKMEEDQMANTFCGSPIYMSPEVLNNQPYDYSSDIWSLGCIFFEMLTGRNPYRLSGCRGPVDLLPFILSSPVPEVHVAFGVSEDTRDVLRQMLAHFPSSRPAASLLREQVGELHVQRTNAAWRSSDASNVPQKSLVSTSPRMPVLTAQSSKETARTLLHFVTGAFGVWPAVDELLLNRGGADIVPSSVTKQLSSVVSRAVLSGGLDANQSNPLDVADHGAGGSDKATLDSTSPSGADLNPVETVRQSATQSFLPSESPPCDSSISSLHVSGSAIKSNVCRGEAVSLHSSAEHLSSSSQVVSGFSDHKSGDCSEDGGRCSDDSTGCCADLMEMTRKEEGAENTSELGPTPLSASNVVSSDESGHLNSNPRDELNMDRIGIVSVSIQPGVDEVSTSSTHHAVTRIAVDTPFNKFDTATCLAAAQIISCVARKLADSAAHQSDECAQQLLACALSVFLYVSSFLKHVLEQQMATTEGQTQSDIDEETRRALLALFTAVLRDTSLCVCQYRRRRGDHATTLRLPSSAVGVLRRAARDERLITTPDIKASGIGAFGTQLSTALRVVETTICG